MGLVHIYCGDGKGKTSAAIGLAVRAAGSGRRVVIARFLKRDNSEVEILKRISEAVADPVPEELWLCPVPWMRRRKRVRGL